MLHVHLFGGLMVTWDEAPLPPIADRAARSLFAYLLTYRDRPHTRNLLAGTFWPDQPEPTARRRLSQALWQIRRALAPHEFLRSEADTLQINPGLPLWLDVEEFTRHKAQGASGEPDAIEHSELCLEHYRGDFLAGYYDDWLLPERERFRDMFLAVLEQLVAAHKNRGEYERALAHARRLAAEDPWREEAHRKVMRLCHVLGRSAEALRQYDTCRQVLADDLDAEPLAETVALALEIARQIDDLEPPLLPSAARPRTTPFLERPDQLPLVGRRQQLADLLRRVEDAAEGHGGLALLYGEAGVGKTRLLTEVARNAQWRGVETVWGRCYELSSPPAYQPLVESLRAALPLLDEAELPPLWKAELCRLLPELSASAESPLQLPPEELRRRLLEALAQAFLALARSGPHLVLLEDVHWMDRASLEAIRYLLPRLADAPLLLVLSARREEVIDEVASLLTAIENTRQSRRLDLACLDLAESEELVRRILALDQPTPRFSARLFGESEGNPFFLIEMLWALVDEGLLYRDAKTGGWSTAWDESTEDCAELPLPASVAQSIERHLDRLPSTQLELLCLGAVIGREVRFDLWHRASDRTQEQVLEDGEELSARGFLLPAEIDAVGAGYSFSHNLIRRVTYDRQPPPRRIRNHARVGGALELLHPDQVEALAHHFFQGQVWHRAVDMNVQSAERARAIYAGAEAIGYYGRAIEAWGHLRPHDDARAVDLYQARGEVYQDTGFFDLAEADFHQASSLAEKNSDPRAQARAVNCQSYLHFQRGELDSAVETARQALRLAERAGSRRQKARALLNQANAIRNQGHPQQAIGLYEQAIPIFEELNDQVRLADCLNRMGGALIWQEAFAQARPVVERSLTIRRRLDDRIGISYSLTNLSYIYLRLGEYARTTEAAQEAFDVATAIGDPYGQDVALANLGHAAKAEGKLDEAVALFERSLVVARRIGDKSLEADVLYSLAEVHHELGSLMRAQESFEQALAGRPDHSTIVSCNVELARLALEMDEKDNALVYAHTALNIAQQSEDLPRLGLAYRTMGEVIARTGGKEAVVEANSHFEESLRLLARATAKADLARTQAVYGLYLLDSSDDRHSQRGELLLQQAGSRFQEPGMEKDLAWLQKELDARAAPREIQVLLARSGAPTGRPLRDDEYVTVTWTAAAPEDDEIGGSVTRRQQRLLRLLQEAEDQGAVPTIRDLAAALAVSQPTVRRDLVALRQAGHRVETRGSRRP